MTWNVAGSEQSLEQDQHSTHLPQADVPYASGVMEEDKQDGKNESTR